MECGWIWSGTTDRDDLGIGTGKVDVISDDDDDDDDMMTSIIIIFLVWTLEVPSPTKHGIVFAF